MEMRRQKKAVKAKLAEEAAEAAAAEELRQLNQDPADLPPIYEQVLAALESAAPEDGGKKPSTSYISFCKFARPIVKATLPDQNGATILQVRLLVSLPSTILFIAYDF